MTTYMVGWRNKKNINTFRLKKCLTWSYELGKKEHFFFLASGYLININEVTSMVRANKVDSIPTKSE